MNHLFLGFLLLFFDFTLTLGNITIGLLPDFLGYYLLIKGIDTLREESEEFSRARPVATVMIVYTAVLWLLDLTGVQTHVGWLLGLLALAASLLVSFRIVTGIQDMETRRGWALEAQKLKLVWMYMAVINVVVRLFIWLPVLNIVGLLAAFIMGVCFLVAVHRTKELYLSHFQ